MNESVITKPIVISGWPLVEIQFNGPATQAQVQGWLDEMDSMFERRQPFGLLTQTSDQSDFSDQGRKAMGLWFKQQRELLAKWCVGVSRVAPSKNDVERLAGPKMQAAMPCPIYASEDRSVALAWLQQQLQQAKTT